MCVNCGSPVLFPGCGCTDTALTTIPNCVPGPSCINPNPCSEIFSTDCVSYAGLPEPRLQILTGDTTTSILEKLIQCCLSSGGGGVQSIAVNDLPPVFTASVANPTTTPVISFALTTQTAHGVFVGPTSGSPAAPTFRPLVASDIPSLPYWGLTGNAGTNHSINFIGTTDSEPLVFKVGNTFSGVISSDFLTSFGINAGNISNSAINTTAFGQTSLSSITAGAYNSAFGFQAGLGFSSGSGNTFIGGNASSQPSTSDNCTTLGFDSTIGTAGLTNANAIGSGALVNSSNSLVLGNNNQTFIRTNVGIGTLTPASTLQLGDIGLSYNATFQYVDGNQASGKILISDSSGNATWQTPPFWDLLGNIGTNSAVNFIGTIDAQDLSVRTNNIITATFSQDGSISSYATGIASSFSGLRLFNGSSTLVGGIVLDPVNGGVLALTDSTGITSKVAINSSIFSVDYINTGFNFGVGTNTPAYKLDVLGDINTSTAYRVGGTPGFTGSGAYTNFTIVGGIITAAS